MSVCLQTKWLWVWIPLLPIKLQILPVSSKAFLRIQATIECRFTLKCMRDMIIKFTHESFRQLASPVVNSVNQLTTRNSLGFWLNSLYFWLPFWNDDYHKRTMSVILVKILVTDYITHLSYHPKVFLKIAFLKNAWKLKGKHLC